LNFDHILKEIDPIISSIINKVIEGMDITESETIQLFNSRGLELNMIVTVANYLCKRKKGDMVTYVINRNINFTNV
jgi:FO synthase subunit 2